jgi:hypothetical protein
MGRENGQAVLTCSQNAHDRNVLVRCAQSRTALVPPSWNRRIVGIHGRLIAGLAAGSEPIWEDTTRQNGGKTLEVSVNLPSTVC